MLITKNNCAKRNNSTLQATSGHETAIVPSHRNRYPVKPDRKPPVELTRQASSEDAIQFLNQFITQARREIRKREKLTLKGVINSTDCDSVSFLCETCSLTINFKEGAAL